MIYVNRGGGGGGGGTSIHMRSGDFDEI